jgi:breast cancer 2 susceptibility protein
LRNGFEGKIVQPDSGSSGSGAKHAPVKFQSVVSNIQTPQNSKKFNVFDEESPYLQRMDSCKTTSVVSFESPLVGRLKNGVESTSVQPDSGLGGGAKQSPIKFQTAGGRSLSISSDALKRARSLLGDPDLGDFFDGGDSLFSFPDKRQTNTITSSVERSESTNTHTPLLHQMTPESNHNHMKKSFTYPLEPFKQMEFSNKLPHEGNGNNLIMKFDDAVNESDCGRKSSNTPGQKPLYNKNDVVNSTTKCSSLNGFSSRMDSRGKPLGRSLVNISNTTTAVDTNNKQPSIRKRRVGLSATVSSFKKPRISNISASGDQGVQNFRNGKHDLGFFLVHSFHIY